MKPLSFAEVQEVRQTFATLTRWTGLPIGPDRLEGRRILIGEGVASVVRFADPMVEPDGELGEFACYTPSLRRFAIHPAGGEGEWRTSENTIGVMVNPTTLRPPAFAEDCYRYLISRETVEPFEADWLDEPVLWPKQITRTEDLEHARRYVADLRPTESVVHARDRLGSCTFLARQVPGRYRELHGGDSIGATRKATRSAPSPRARARSVG